MGNTPEVYPPNNGIPKQASVVEVLNVLQQLYINGMSLAAYIQQTSPPVTPTSTNSYFPSGW